MSRAVDELRQLAREEPESVRHFAEKASEPIRNRLLALIEEEEEKRLNSLPDS